MTSILGSSATSSTATLISACLRQKRAQSWKAAASPSPGARPLLTRHCTCDSHRNLTCVLLMRKNRRLPDGDSPDACFRWMRAPSASKAAAVAQRCLLVKVMLDIWGEGSTLEDCVAAALACPGASLQFHCLSVDASTPFTQTHLHVATALCRQTPRKRRTWSQTRRSKSAWTASA